MSLRVNAVVVYAKGSSTDNNLVDPFNAGANVTLHVIGVNVNPGGFDASNVCTTFERETGVNAPATSLWAWTPSGLVNGGQISGAMYTLVGQAPIPVLLLMPTTSQHIRSTADVTKPPLPACHWFDGSKFVVGYKRTHSNSAIIRFDDIIVNFPTTRASIKVRQTVLFSDLLVEVKATRGTRQLDVTTVAMPPHLVRAIFPTNPPRNTVFQITKHCDARDFYLFKDALECFPGEQQLTNRDIVMRARSVADFQTPGNAVAITRLFYRENKLDAVRDLRGLRRFNLNHGKDVSRQKETREQMPPIRIDSTKTTIGDDADACGPRIFQSDNGDKPVPIMAHQHVSDAILLSMFAFPPSPAVLTDSIVRWAKLVSPTLDVSDITISVGTDEEHILVCDNGVVVSHPIADTLDDLKAAHIGIKTPVTSFRSGQVQRPRKSVDVFPSERVATQPTGDRRHILDSSKITRFLPPLGVVACGADSFRPVSTILIDGAWWMLHSWRAFDPKKPSKASSDEAILPEQFYVAVYTKSKPSPAFFGTLPGLTPKDHEDLHRQGTHQIHVFPCLIKPMASKSSSSTPNPVVFKRKRNLSLPPNTRVLAQYISNVDEASMQIGLFGLSTDSTNHEICGMVKINDDFYPTKGKAMEAIRSSFYRLRSKEWISVQILTNNSHTGVLFIFKSKGDTSTIALEDTTDGSDDEYDNVEIGDVWYKQCIIEGK